MDTVEYLVCDRGNEEEGQRENNFVFNVLLKTMVSGNCFQPASCHSVRTVYQTSKMHRARKDTWARRFVTLQETSMRRTDRQTDR